MANVNDTDTFLVNRSNSSYQLQAQNLMAELRDDDLMLVNRSNVTYTATGADIKASLKPPVEVLKPQILAPANGAGSTVAPETDVIINVVAPSGPVTYEGRGSNYASSTPNWNLSGATPIPLNSTTPVTLQTWDFVASTSYTNNVGDQPPQSGGSGTSYQIHYFKLDVAGIVSFVRYPSEIPASMYLIFYSDDGNSWSYDETATELSASKGIVMYPDISVRGTDDHLYWAISRISIADFEAKSNQATCTATAAYNYGVGDAVNHTDLTLDGEKSLDVLQVGDLIKQDDDAASGIIDGITKAGNASKIKVMPSFGTWSANTGNYVVGPESLSADAAPDPSGVNFVGSAFASSDGSLVAASADWQVAELADTGYTSPISQVTGHPEMGPPPTWTSGALADDTEYRARTKYKAASGEESPWSDDVTFKTEAKNVYISTPGDVWASRNRTARFITSPAKIVMLSITNDYYAVGVDNKLYVGLGDTSTSLADTGIAFPTTPVTGYAKYGTKAPAAFAMSNGDLHVITGTTGSWVDNKSSLGKAPVQLSVDFGSYKVWVLLKDGEVRHTSGNAFTNASEFTSWMTGTDYKHFAVAGKKWDGTAGPTFYGVKSDGTVDAVDQTTKAVTPVPGVTGIARVVTTNSGVVTLVKADGSELLFGGSLSSHFNPPITSVTPPTGDKWNSVGGGYQTIYATTAAGRAYEAVYHGLLGANSQYFPTRSAGAGEIVSHMPPFTMINLPRPVETVSMQEVSPGGNQGALIIP